MKLIINKKLLLLFYSLSLGIFVSAQTLNSHAFCFYYNWFGSATIDGDNYHWKHPVMPQNDKDTNNYIFEGNGNIGADFYPASGEYSSCDSSTIKRHMQEMALAGIGIIAVTWLGENDYSYRSVPIILDMANRYQLKVCFQIEPIVRKNPLTTKQAIEFIIQTFGTHPAFYREEKTKRPLFFIYDSYIIPANEWHAVFSKNDKPDSFRNSEFDSDIIGLWCWKEDSSFFLNSGFDGFYTYFASREFTYGANPDNWSKMQHFADRNQLIFIPSVGPGYSDNRIRPWNIHNTKSRENGQYYDDFFQSAIDANVKWIGITSYNEWHEGTQIEPAQPMSHGAYHYQDYGNLPVDFYLKRTLYWLQKFN
jgi:glycoprotein endo-alpha-1,2-mannosidase